MRFSFPKKLFAKSKKSYHTTEYNHVVRHWLFLLTLFFVLLCTVGASGFVLYRYFILGTGASFGEPSQQSILLDEKKLKAVIERIEKRTALPEIVGTSTPRFIDPSIPF